MDNSKARRRRGGIEAGPKRFVGLALLLALAGACTEVEDRNQPPVAIAGEDQQLAYDGSPIKVTLDGSKSYDPDGEIVEYIWYDTGICSRDRYRFIEPPDLSGQIFDWDNVIEYKGDPPNEAKPVGELDQGEYRYTLWVKDDNGSVSIPDSVIIKVGSSGPALPTSCRPEAEDEDAGTDEVLHEAEWRPPY